MKGKGKCLQVTGSSRCSKCYCCKEVLIFSNLMFIHNVICYEILSVCLGAEKSFLMTKYKYWLASAHSQVTPTAIGCSEREKCPLFTPWTDWVVFAAFVYALIIIQSHNKTLEFWLVCMKCISRNLIWIGFHAVYECGLDWIVKINVHGCFLLFGWHKNNLIAIGYAINK